MLRQYIFPTLAFGAIVSATALVSAKPPLAHPSDYINRAESVEISTDSYTRGADMIGYQGRSELSWDQPHFHRISLKSYMNVDTGLLTSLPHCSSYHYVVHEGEGFDRDCNRVELYHCQPTAAYAAGHLQGFETGLDIGLELTSGDLTYADGVQIGKGIGWNEAAEAFKNQVWDLWGFKLHKPTLENLGLIIFTAFAASLLIRLRVK